MLKSTPSYQDAIPDVVHTVVVPVANPITAPHLLRLANALVNPVDGKIIALFISSGDIERQAEALDDIREIIDEFTERGHPIEFLTHPAVSVARGILDVVRERDVDLLILGLSYPKDGAFELGSIAKNVAEAAPCPLLIYRAARGEDFDRVVVPADGSEHARVACRLAIRLAKHFNTAVEAVEVHNSKHTRAEGLMRLDQSLAGLPDQEMVKRTVLEADDPLTGLLRYTNARDLLVIGFRDQPVLERWFSGPFSQELFDAAPGPVILTARMAREHSLDERLRRRLKWIFPTLTDIEQEEVTWEANEMASRTLDYTVLTILAALLCSFGLLLNNEAVIIGAMLVAPLNDPLTSFATGLSSGQFGLIRRAFTTALYGILLALPVAFLTGLIVQVETPTAMMLSQARPTLLDAGVALTAGIVGAYALARRGISVAIAGVAVATTVIPPLCMIGLSAAFFRLDLLSGSLVLFLANIVNITIASWVVFLWLGMRPRFIDNGRRRLHTMVILLLLATVPLVAFLINLSSREGAVGVIQRRMEEEFSGEVIDADSVDTDPLQVTFTFRTDEEIIPADLAAFEILMENELDRQLDLGVVIQQIVRPPATPTPTA